MGHCQAPGVEFLWLQHLGRGRCQTTWLPLSVVLVRVTINLSRRLLVVFFGIRSTFVLSHVHAPFRCLAKFANSYWAMYCPSTVTQFRGVTHRKIRIFEEDITQPTVTLSHSCDGHG